MKHLSLAPIFFLLTSAVLAQDTTRYYYDAAWKETSADKASYYRKKFKTAAGWGVLDYYASGQVQMKGGYSNDSCSVKSGEFAYYNRNGTLSRTVSYLNDKPEGPEAYYYDNGQKQVEGNNHNAVAEGEWAGYYPSGKLSGKAVYKDGKEQKIELFKEDGTRDENMHDFMKESMFPGGLPALRDFLISNTRYPKQAQKDNIQGTVRVSFTVSEKGDVEDIQISKSLHPLLDAEALRIIKKMPRWEPAVMGGRYIKSYKIQPIGFRLEDK
jgi:protein TonB